MIVESTPGIDKVRFACSGTEAVMTAIRLARLVTRRATIVKFKGASHGHSDQVLAPHTDSLGALAAEPVWKGNPLGTVSPTRYASLKDRGGPRDEIDEAGGGRTDRAGTP